MLNFPRTKLQTPVQSAQTNHAADAFNGININVQSHAVHISINVVNDIIINQ